jgi:hypothetical protein
MMKSVDTIGRMYKDINPFGLRIPTKLREQIEASAKEHHRSLNAELVARLQESMEVRNELQQFSDGELIQELILRWGRENIFIELGHKGK